VLASVSAHVHGQLGQVLGGPACGGFIGTLQVCEALVACLNRPRH
jgi:hypothetical protein